MAYFLRLLGGLSLEGPSGPVSGPAAQRRQLAILAMLATKVRDGLSRDKLLACLWPENTAESARHSLADALYRLRKEFGRTAILGKATTLRLDSRVIRTDVAEFETAMEAGDLEAAVDLYGGPFLDGVHLRDAAEFDRWKDTEARRLELKAQAALETLADRAEAAGDASQSAHWLRGLLGLDPYNSRTVLRLMKAQAAMGDPANAVKLASEHRKLLAEELGVDLPADVLELADQLGSAQRPIAEPSQGRRFPFEVRPWRQSRAEPVFVGRNGQLQRLHDSLGRALAGDGGVVFVTGEAGTGKTALAATFCRHALERVRDLVVAGGNGDAYTGPRDPYVPFREILDLLNGGVQAQYEAGSMPLDQATRLWEMVPRTARELTRTAPDLLDTFIDREVLRARLKLHAGGDRLSDLADVFRPRAVPQQSTFSQPMLFDQYARLLKALASEKPLLLVLDDLQWADSGSLGMLFHLGKQLAGSRILLLGLYRPSDVAVGRDGGRHPLDPIVNELTQTFGDIGIGLDQDEGRGFVDALVDNEPNTLDDGFRAMLFSQTRGHALFTTELLRVMRDRGMLVRQRGRWCATPDLDWALVPARIQAMLAERIGRLPETLRRILEVASVEGEEFTLEAVAAVSGVPAGELLPLISGDLERRYRLVHAHGVSRVEGRLVSEFRFRHILFQRFLYDGLDAVERVHLHERVGLALETLYGEMRTTIAARLGWHFGQAGLADQTARYLYLAGRQAHNAAAFPESAAHLRSALEQLLTLPAGADRDRRELDILAELGNAQIYAAAADLDEPFARMRELAGRLGDDRLVFWAITGLYWSKAHHPGDHRLGHELGQEAVALARKLGDETLVPYACEIAGRGALMRGDFRDALAYYREMERSYEPSYRDPFDWYLPLNLGSSAHAELGLTLWPLGYADEARASTHRAIDMAARMMNPGSLLMARMSAAFVHLWRREVDESYEQSREVESSTRDNEFRAHYGPLGLIVLGWSLAHMGRADEGIDAARKGVTTRVEAGFHVARTFYTSLLAEALLAGGRAEEGLDVLDEAVANSPAIDEFWVEADIRRTRGDLLIALPVPDRAEAESAYRSAMELAQKQEARGYELRAAVRLARLMHVQGRDDEARPILEEVCDWFSEGFDTADLQQARTLLKALG